MGRKAAAAFKRVQRLPAFRKSRRKEAQEFKPLVPETPEEGDGLTALVRQLGGDAQLARRIAKLQAQYPVGSLPELITYDWLTKKGIPFEYQVSLFGGRRAVAGMGLLPDFVVFQDRDGASVWQIQGEYWHSVALKGDKDETARLRMLGQRVNGVRIKQVLELWEEDILHKRPQVYQMALAGLELRR